MTNEQLIHRVLSGEASVEERMLLASMLEGDDNLRLSYQAYAESYSSLFPSVSPHIIHTDKALAKVKGRLRMESTSSISLWTLFQRVAAVIVLPLLLWVGYLLNRTESEVSVGNVEISTPYGTRSRLTLSDGSKVWLNAGSKLSYPAVFTDAKRVVELHGEGYFEVSSDTLSPFVVITDRVRVVATGTAFNVEDYPQDSLVCVTLANGVVNVSSRLSGMSRSLDPGSRFLFNPGSGLSMEEPTDPSRWSAWKEGLMVFRDDRLDYVFNRLCKTYNVRFELKDRSLALERYRATFENESLSEILRLLELSAPIKFKVNERWANPAGTFSPQVIEVERR